MRCAICPSSSDDMGGIEHCAGCTQAARLVADVEAVEAETDLGGLDAIEGDGDFLKAARQQIVGHAEVAAALYPHSHLHRHSLHPCPASVSCNPTTCKIALRTVAWW